MTMAHSSSLGIISLRVHTTHYYY